MQAKLLVTINVGLQKDSRSLYGQLGLLLLKYTLNYFSPLLIPYIFVSMIFHVSPNDRPHHK